MTPYWDNGPVQLYQADAREIPLPDGSVHCVVTSPPYFGLRVYKDNDDRGIGLEASVEAYIANLVAVFREVRRCLRDDGCCWVNLGDSYSGSSNSKSTDETEKNIARAAARGYNVGSWGASAHAAERFDRARTETDLQPGNRLGIPERVVLALQADGWIWRDTVIWAKKSAMPESLRGWVWTRCRVKLTHETLPALSSDQADDRLCEQPSEQGRFADVLPNVHGEDHPGLQGHSGGNGENPASSAALASRGWGQGQPTGISESASGEGKDSDSQVGASGEVSQDGQMESIPGEGQSEEASAVSKFTSHSNFGRMGSNQASKQVPLLLLQEEGAAGNRSCNSCESGRGDCGGEHCTGVPDLQREQEQQNNDAFIDCPGCAKCSANNGLVLRKGSWRTTSSHEYIYMLTKGMGYYADGEAVKTAASGNLPWGKRGNHDNYNRFDAQGPHGNHSIHTGMSHEERIERHNSGANRRSVWSDISPEPYGGAHFATFPSDLPRICIQASTSEAGCCSECGAQWARVVETKAYGDWEDRSRPRMDEGRNSGGNGQKAWDAYVPPETLGWRPTCGHDAPAVPATVLDCFGGTGTTALAAQRLGRRAVCVDISEAYLQQAVKRLEAVSLPLGT